MQVKIDQYTMFFDDLWVFRLSEKQQCYVWAVDNHEKTYTPLDDNFKILKSYKDLQTIYLVQPDSCDWVLRNTLVAPLINDYTKAINTLIQACKNAKWPNGKVYMLNNPLKMSELLGKHH